MGVVHRAIDEALECIDERMEMGKEDEGYEDDEDISLWVQLHKLQGDLYERENDQDAKEDKWMESQKYHAGKEKALQAEIDTLKARAEALSLVTKQSSN
jgi:hypothetical protein